MTTIKETGPAAKAADPRPNETQGTNPVFDNIQQKEQNYKNLAMPLFEKGFIPLPVKGKIPVLTEWQKRPITAETIADDAKNGCGSLNVGIRLGECHAIDIDVYDEDMVASLVEYLEDINDGGVPMRVGQPPKVMVPCIIDGVDKKETLRFIDEHGVLHGIEILATGQQFVAYGIHPDTRKPYQWYGEDLLSAKLPEFADLDITGGLFDRFLELAEARGWQEVKAVDKESPPKRAYNPDDDPDRANSTKPGDIYKRTRGHEIHDLLIKHGWKYCYTNKTNDYFTRPGKEKGVSASWNGTVFYVFSTNAKGFNGGQGYDAFGVYARLEHGGDMSAAGKALADEIIENTDYEFEQTTEVPDDEYLDLNDMVEGSGFLEEFSDYLCNQGLRRHRGAAMLAGMVLLSAICNRVVIDNHCRPNMYVLDVGKTGTGKTSSTQKPCTELIKSSRKLRKYFSKLDYSSDSAFKQVLRKQPVLAILKDEIGGYLREMNNPSSHIYKMQEMLLDGFSDHTGVSYNVAERARCFETEYCFFSIFGSTTDTRFQECLKDDNVGTGLLPRFLIHFGDSSKAGFNKKKDIKSIAPDHIIDVLERLEAEMAAELLDVETMEGPDIHVNFDEEAAKKSEEYSKACSLDAEKAGHDGGFINRRNEYVTKMAFMHALSRQIADVELLGDFLGESNFLPASIGVESFKWAKDIVERHGSWIKTQLHQHLHTGEEGEVATKIHRYMKMQFKKGNKMVRWSDICNGVRARSLHIKREAMKALVAEGKVGVKTSDSGRGDVYFLTKKVRA